MEEKMLVVAVDAMGGDNAPGDIVRGAVNAVSHNPRLIVKLVGREEAVQAELAKAPYDAARIQVVHAPEVIGTDEVPTLAVRRKRDSSMIVGLNLVKKGEAMAFVSAGSTGALLTGATVIVGRLPGIQRPALGTCLPTLNGSIFLLDSGANVDCKPVYLEQFAKMGAVYVEQVLGVKDPTVGLANIGVEEEKGNALVKEAFGLLKETVPRFAGNVEVREVPFGPVDVLVCDGFVGNVILKLCEGMAKALFGMIKGEITVGAYKLAAAALKTPFKNIKKRFDSEEVGGAPLLGLKALVVKAHGNAGPRAIENAIALCTSFIEKDVVQKIQANIGQVMPKTEAAAPDKE